MSKPTVARIGTADLREQLEDVLRLVPADSRPLAARTINTVWQEYHRRFAAEVNRQVNIPKPERDGR